MKILEMRPRAYDRRMDRVSRGRVRRIKEAVAREVPENSHVLEIGCGTGEMAAIMIERGCRVQGFDLSPFMVEEAEKRVEREALEDKFSPWRMGVEGMDNLPVEDFDAVVSTLVFSELNDDERRFALIHAARLLRAGGLIVIADEVVPRKALGRLLHTVLRLPLQALTYLVSGQSTHPLADLARDIGDAGFIVEKELRSHGDSFALVTGRKQEGAS
jgi:demethylmenaquinone methyltransferase/2-methoxy-6-polyprenyl-1,4-benzoquinol methylase